MLVNPDCAGTGKMASSITQAIPGYRNSPAPGITGVASAEAGMATPSLVMIG